MDLISGSKRSNISIHALREEGDTSAFLRILEYSYFYPRPPRGGRQEEANKKMYYGNYFYPRPPRGGRPTLRP